MSFSQRRIRIARYRREHPRVAALSIAASVIGIVAGLVQLVTTSFPGNQAEKKPVERPITISTTITYPPPLIRAHVSAKPDRKVPKCERIEPRVLTVLESELNEVRNKFNAADSDLTKTLATLGTPVNMTALSDLQTGRDNLKAADVAMKCGGEFAVRHHIGYVRRVLDSLSK